MTEPATFNPDETPAIELAGKAWPVPALAWKQLKACRRELLELTWLVNEAIAASPAETGADDDARVAANMNAMSRVFRELSNDDYDRLVMGPILAALTALHPALTRAEFESWQISEADRQIAWLTVRRQSGQFVIRDARGADSEPASGAAPGEVAGAA